MLATPRKATAPTVTGRSYARRVASLTGGSRRIASGAWVAEARGVERRRRAVACRIGQLTGTRAPQWSGEIGEEDWRTVLAAGADAVLTLAEAGQPVPSLELLATAREFAQEAAESTSDHVVDRTRDGRAEALVDDVLAARPASVVDGPAGNDERRLIERWSPFRSGPRYVCRSGRYGDGTPAPQH